MTKLAAKLRTLHAYDKGATMVEYAIMVALIAVVVMLAVGPLGEAISGLFDDVSASL